MRRCEGGHRFVSVLGGVAVRLPCVCVRGVAVVPRGRCRCGCAMRANVCQHVADLSGAC